MCAQGAVTERTAVERPAIRIHSDRKWPERVILDTTLPVVAAETSAPSITEPAPRAPAELPVVRAETTAVANALAMVRADSPPREAIQHKRPTCRCGAGATATLDADQIERLVEFGVRTAIDVAGRYSRSRRNCDL